MIVVFWVLFIIAYSLVGLGVWHLLKVLGGGYVDQGLSAPPPIPYTRQGDKSCQYRISIQGMEMCTNINHEGKGVCPIINILNEEEYKQIMEEL